MLVSRSESPCMLENRARWVPSAAPVPPGWECSFLLGFIGGGMAASAPSSRGPDRPIVELSARQLPKPLRVLAQHAEHLGIESGAHLGARDRAPEGDPLVEGEPEVLRQDPAAAGATRPLEPGGQPGGAGIAGGLVALG